MPLSAQGGDAVERFGLGQAPAVGRGEVGGEDLKPVCGPGGFDQGGGSGFGRFQQRSIGPFQLHRRAVVDVQGQRAGTLLLAQFVGFEDRLALKTGWAKARMMQAIASKRINRTNQWRMRLRERLSCLTSRRNAVWENWTFRCRRKLNRWTNTGMASAESAQRTSGWTNCIGVRI